MKKRKTGLLIGRFQPFHKGHIFLFKKALERVDKLIVGIGSPDTVDHENFFSFSKRKMMLEKVANMEGWIKRIIAILPITDYLEDDQLWLQKTLETVKKISSFDVFIGNDPWTSGIFEKNGYKVMRCGFFKRYLYEGAKIRRLILKGENWKDRVPKYLVEDIETRHKLNHIILGGTFDHFHKGHIAFLDFALKLADKLSIGIAKENLYKGKFLQSSIESYTVRKQSVSDYLKKRKAIQRVKLIPITDIYGTSLTDSSIEAIVVTKQTISGAEKINKQRKKENLRPLKIITAPFIRDETGQIISSERIRTGEINRSGHVYIKLFRNIQKLVLPKNLRETLRIPLGDVIKGDQSDIIPAAKKAIILIKKMKPTMVIAVGDIIAISLLKIGYTPDISIIDLRSRRKDMIHESMKIFSRVNSSPSTRSAHSGSSNTNSQKNFISSFINEPGTINRKAVDAIVLGLKENIQTETERLIIIKGEEDLLTLPAILLAPLGSVVCYGQWNLGVIVVTVTEEIKKNIEKICTRFIVVR